MSRMQVDDLAVPVRLGEQLPEIYRRFDPGAMAFTEALDEVLAPLWAVLDNYESYFDPFTAPMDFVELLARWIGWPVDRNWSEELTRHLVAEAVGLYPWRGTMRGLSDLVVAYSGIIPEISETGRVERVDSVDAAVESTGRAAVRVRLEVSDGTSVDIDRLLRLIEANTPAHVGVNIETGGSAAAEADEPTPPGDGPSAEDAAAAVAGPDEAAEDDAAVGGTVDDAASGPPEADRAEAAPEPPEPGPEPESLPRLPPQARKDSDDRD